MIYEAYQCICRIPPILQDITQNKISSGVKLLNSDFSFSKAEDFSQLYYSVIAWVRTCWFMPFPIALLRKER